MMSGHQFHPILVPKSTDIQSLARDKVYTGYHGTSKTEHGLCACMIVNPLAKARGSSLHTGAQTILWPSLKPCNIRVL